MESRQESSEKFITSSMISFINRSIKSAQLSSLDEIVFNYVETVLESLATEPGALQDVFDVEEFCEILSAYFPEFSSIPHPIVSQWIFDMVAALKESTKKDKPLREPVAFESLLCEFESEREPRSKRNSESSSDSSSYCSYNGKKSSCSSRTTHVSETSESDADVADIIHRIQMSELENDNKIHTLMEMFPTLLKSDAQNYISITKGDLEKAVQMVLIQTENGEISNSPQQANLPNRPRQLCGSKSMDVDEKTLKDRIVARYGFIDQAEDAKEFRPPPLKAEPKKLVRYRESQVVTTKGERYSEVRGMKDAEETLSKNYLNKASRHN